MAPHEPCRFRSGELQLEGSFVGEGHERGAVIAPPHPLYGGTLSNPVVVTAQEALVAAEFVTLRFNFRGTEASEGQATDSLEAAVEDYQAAFAELAARVPGPYVFAGYSFGAGTALLAAREDTRALGAVLIAPPLGLLRAEDLAAFGRKLLVVVGDDDDYAPLAELESRLRAQGGAALEVIAGTDHFFHYGGLRELRKRITEHVTSWR